MLQIKNLICARNENILFKNIGINLNPGEVLQIVGKNGSGKTTFLRTIAGLLQPFGGKIDLNNMRICYVGHKSGLHPDLTVQQNLEFLQSLESATPKTSIAESLKHFTLRNKQHVRSGELSAGQMQRASLTRLLLTSAQLWLLDEPLANLDAEATASLQSLCAAHLAAQGTLIIATHNAMNFSPFNVQELNLQQYV